MLWPTVRRSGRNATPDRTLLAGAAAKASAREDERETTRRPKPHRATGLHPTPGSLGQSLLEPTPQPYALTAQQNTVEKLLTAGA